MKLKRLINYLLEETAKTFSGLYHGSSRRFKEFSLPSKVSQRGSGIFFSNSLNYAKEFGPYIYSCNVKLSNPKVYATSLDFTIAEMKQGSVEHLYSDLKTEGYDGIIINRSKVSTGVVKEVIAFEPSQVEMKEVLEISGDFWYHTTSKDNAQKIKTEGLRINPSGIGKSIASLAWMNDIYGMTPIFLSRDPAAYKNGVVVKVNIKGLKLVADVPSLADWGAQITEDKDRLFFDEGDEPEELSKYLNKSGEILYSNLINPEYDGTKAAIELTKTAAVMQNIGPESIEVTNIIVENIKEEMQLNLPPDYIVD